MYPKIKYTLIGNETNILIDYYKNYGEFVDYTINSIFPLIQKSKKIGIYIWTSHHYDYIYIKKSNGLVILSMIEKGFKKDVAILYLNEIYEELLSNYKIEELNKKEEFNLLDFKKNIETINSSYNSQYLDLVQKTLTEIVNTKSILVESLDKITERASQFEDLQKKIEEINNNQILLMDNTGKLKYLKKKEKCNFLFITALVFFFSILFYFSLTLFCGGFNLKRCF